MKCNFVILMASQFNSGFGKPDFSETNILFQTKDGEKLAKEGDSFSADIDNQEICKKLIGDVVFG